MYLKDVFPFLIEKFQITKAAYVQVITEAQPPGCFKSFLHVFLTSGSV